MSEISYFQKYTQQENHITNNTLLMFRHLYRHNPLGFQRFLNSMIDDENLEVGLVFQQQVRVAQAVPDGIISQEPFNIYIEAKRNGKLNQDQISRHLQSAREKKKSYILGLTKNSLSVQELEQYENLCGEEVTFVAITYTNLVRLLKEQAKDHETDLIEIIDDYEQFLLSEYMVAKPSSMLCAACNTSFEANVEHKIYYEPEDKPDKTMIPFLGIYRNKTIVHLGKIKTSAIATYENEELNISGNLLDEEETRIRQIFESVHYHRNNLIAKPHRYYIIEDLVEVNLRKTSRGPVRVTYNLDLEKNFSANLEINTRMEQIADAIRGKPFE